jgi:steroid 5-alpha reductase family enzyme
MNELWPLLAIVTLGLVVIMGLAWVAQWVTHNAGWVDVVWSLGTGLGGAAAALVPLPGSHGVMPRQWVVAVLVAVWSVRLAIHIARRTLGHPEDVRYATFRRDWGAAFQTRMASLLVIQAAAAALLTLSILVAARNPAPAWRPADWAGIAILAIAILGEAVADAQLHRFRAAANGPALCDRGLWGWSRHPNYFFEWLGWCAYPLLAIDTAGGWWPGWLALSGPVFMYWLLRHVSGVPPLEAAMLQSRGEPFRHYQRRVSAFFPWPPRLS